MLLVDAVRNVNDWHNLGLHLYLEEAKLEEIRITYHVYGFVSMKTEMFKVWLKSCPDASWHKLVSALNAIDEKRVAKEVESRYCKQLPGNKYLTYNTNNYYTACRTCTITPYPMHMQTLIVLLQSAQMLVPRTMLLVIIVLVRILNIKFATTFIFLS